MYYIRYKKTIFISYFLSISFYNFLEVNNNSNEEKYI